MGALMVGKGEYTGQYGYRVRTAVESQKVTCHYCERQVRINTMTGHLRFHTWTHDQHKIFFPDLPYLDIICPGSGSTTGTARRSY